MPLPLRIGLTARLMYPDPDRSVLATKTVQYAEENAANWLMTGGAAVFIIPRPSPKTATAPGGVRLIDYVNALDGLVLQGGSDVSPGSYGEEPLRPEWSGDALRDTYELELFHEFMRQRKPVFGICRGCQLINVGLGGSLYQDLATQLPASGHHRDEALYDANYHAAALVPDSSLAVRYPGVDRFQLNSIHHQAIKQLGAGLVVEARSVPDGLVEAVRWSGPGYVVGVQWHPEFTAPDEVGLLPGGPLRDEFLAACEQRRQQTS